MRPPRAVSTDTSNPGMRRSVLPEIANATSSRCPCRYSSPWDEKTVLHPLTGSGQPRPLKRPPSAVFADTLAVGREDRSPSAHGVGATEIAIATLLGQQLTRALECPPAETYQWALQTGTGFITVEKPNGNSSNLTSDHATHDCHPSCRGNPATNEWVPSTEMDIPTSHKPNRSDI
ncbi:hypothetical protein Taro_025545 [Colocasia esculenta]|uniref:Uncharacterized protein n=1 Tax=Colocasia esculenta TaxID=4460 RepID=A0A843VAF4_COLES|nr:hypothetical protein [Colocasia esculenta]